MGLIVHVLYLTFLFFRSEYLNYNSLIYRSHFIIIIVLISLNLENFTIEGDIYD